MPRFARLPDGSVVEAVTLVNALGDEVVALAAPPANLSAGVNTELTFESAVFVVEVENNSGEDKAVAFPSPATAGSRRVLDGEVREFTIPAGTTTMGIYGASASPLNGAAAGNVIVEGRK